MYKVAASHQGHVHRQHRWKYTFRARYFKLEGERFPSKRSEMRCSARSHDFPPQQWMCTQGDASPTDVYLRDQKNKGFVWHRGPELRVGSALAPMGGKREVKGEDVRC